MPLKSARFLDGRRDPPSVVHMQVLFCEKLTFMNTYSRLFTIAALILCAKQSPAQTYDTNNIAVQTLSGSGFSGYMDGVGQQSMFNGPNALVADSQGNIFLWDSQNVRIRKITPAGEVTTFAGGGNLTAGVGTAAYVQLYLEGGSTQLTIDANDTIWGVQGFSTFANGRSGLFGTSLLTKISSGAAVTSTNLFPSLFNSSHAFSGICLDSKSNIYIADAIANVIYRYTTNRILEVFAGSGNSGYVDGKGIFTAFTAPGAMTIGTGDNIYVWDSGNNVVRRIDEHQQVTTVAGKPGFNIRPYKEADGPALNATICSISQMCFDNSGRLLFVGGPLYYGGGLCLRALLPTGIINTVAGSFTNFGYANGDGKSARFSAASGVCVLGSMLYVADTGNQRIRSVSYNPVVQPVTPNNLRLLTYPGLEIVGTVGRTYQIQSSANMTNWITRENIVINCSPFQWIDASPISGNRFYRALLLP